MRYSNSQLPAYLLIDRALCYNFAVMVQKTPPQRDRKRYWLNLTLAGVAAQSGCVTLAIVLVAVLAGLWLDNIFHTKPALTFILVIISVPISILAMLIVVRTATSKIKTGATKSEAGKQEVDSGKD